jgi:hypothetical protein
MKLAWSRVKFAIIADRESSQWRRWSLMNASIYSMHASAAICCAVADYRRIVPRSSMDTDPQENFGCQVTNNRQKVGNGRSLRWKKAIKLLILLALPRGLQGLSDFSGLLARLATDVSRPFS